jgi:hypothetical protein
MSPLSYASIHKDVWFINFIKCSNYLYVLSIIMFSYAGIPLLAIFYNKLNLVFVALSCGLTY